LIESELFGHDKGAFTGAHKEKRGAFELAGKGTLFIDEVDSLPLGLQVKVLSFLDDKKFRSVGSESSKEARCRVIFASGRKIEALVEEEKFRMDLFFRIGSGLKVKLRPLRSNPDLLISIIRNFEKEQGVSFSKECIQFYLEAKWPGNIRQFKSHLWRKLYSESSSRLVRLSQEDHELGSFTGGIGELEESNILELKHVKREHCRKIYMGSHESIPLAAKRLRIAQTTLRRILTG
jgi:transcriptional regulator with PAS, ATPase and Fis domain